MGRMDVDSNKICDTTVVDIFMILRHTILAPMNVEELSRAPIMLYHVAVLNQLI